MISYQGHSSYPSAPPHPLDEDEPAYGQPVDTQSFDWEKQPAYGQPVPHTQPFNVVNQSAYGRLAYVQIPAYGQPSFARQNFQSSKHKNYTLMLMSAAAFACICCCCIIPAISAILGTGSTKVSTNSGPSTAYTTEAACYSSINTYLSSESSFTINGVFTTKAKYDRITTNGIRKADVSLVYDWYYSGNYFALYTGINGNTNTPACREAHASSGPYTYTLIHTRTLTIPGCYQVFSFVDTISRTCYSGAVPFSGSNIIAAIWITDSSSL